jgi:hypothetical protein
MEFNLYFNNSQIITKWAADEVDSMLTVIVCKNTPKFVFRPKTTIFWREGGFPLPIAFQYLINMI